MPIRKPEGTGRMEHELQELLKLRDARIAELETAGREYVTRTDQQIEAQHERIAELEKELKIARDEISDLRAFIEGMKRHVAAAAKMFGLSS